MRVVGRAAATAVAALVVGLVASFVAAAMLRSATPQADLLWRVAGSSDVAIWTLAGAYGVPLEVRAGIEVDDRVGEIGDQIGDRIGDIFGRDVVPDVPDVEGSAGGDLRIRFASFTILGLIGAVLAGGMFLARPRTVREALGGAAVAAVALAVSIAGLATTAGAGSTVDLRIVSAGAEVSVPVVATFLLAAVWSFLFASIGGLHAPEVVAGLPVLLRAAGGAARRAALVGAAATAVCLIVLALTRGSGSAPGLGGDLTVVGVFLLGVNVLAAGIVLAHGASMAVSLDAGPFSQWTKLGYFPEGSQSLPPARWLFLVVPILAGLAAGRAMRRRGVKPVEASLAFGALWGIAAGAIAAMLRVDVLSSFSLGSLAAGGGVQVGVVEAALLAFVWGAVTSYIGQVLGSGEPRGAPAPTSVAERVPIAEPAAVVAVPRACASCGAQVPADDSFCAACGQRV